MQTLHTDHHVGRVLYRRAGLGSARKATTALGTTAPKASATLAVTALLVLAAAVIWERVRRKHNALDQDPAGHFDYSNRSGLPQTPAQMRGSASGLEIPRDMRTPAALRPLTSRQGARAASPGPGGHDKEVMA